jgi:hypothetical protein
MKMFNVLPILTLLFLIGCAKERDTKFVQGQGGPDLYAINEWQGKVINEQTGQGINGESTIAGSDNVSVSETLEDRRFRGFDLVPVESNHELLSDTTIRGRAGTNYQFQFEVTENHLIVNKVVAEADLPQLEKTYAKEITSGANKGMYKVPLHSYSAQLIKVQTILNSNDEATDRIQEYPARNLAEATHFRINKHNRERINAQQKVDVFPKDMFEGDWFYAATIVSAASDKATLVGRDLSVDFNFESVSRVKFNKTKEFLQVANKNIADNIDTSDDINYEIALDIPVSWVDYRLKTDGSKAGVEEELIEDGDPEAKHWEERDWVKIDFKSVAFPFKRAGVFEETLTTERASYEDFQIAKDYFSFVLYYPNREMKIKFAFRKAHEAKEGTVYNFDDRKKFGFFVTRRKFTDGVRYTREEELEKQYFLNRFYPEVDPKYCSDGETCEPAIVYYFSKRTPEYLKDVGREAVRVWDEAFVEAQTGIRVKLDESKLVELGDLRYNIINIVDSRDGAGLLGYGPSISDSYSGELISASSNIYANPFRETAMRQIRNYIRSRKNLFDQKYLGATQGHGTTSAESDSIELAYRQFVKQFQDYNNLLDSFSVEVPSTVAPGVLKATPKESLVDSLLENNNFNWTNHLLQVKERPGYIPPTNYRGTVFNSNTLFDQLFGENSTAKVNAGLGDALEKGRFFEDVLQTQNKTIAQFQREGFSRERSLNNFINDGNFCSYGVHNADIVAKIEKYCKDDIEAYIYSLGENETWNSDEIALLEKCSVKLIEEQVLATLIHEMGHNFGLRHNFLASSDPDNYHYRDQAREVPLAKSSSTMDYQPGHHVDELPKPGPYDIAAIRFGYGNKIRISSPRDSVVTLADNSKPIEWNLQNLTDSEGNRISNATLYPYKYCTDEHTGFRSWTPMCNRHDDGRTPLELVTYLIDDFKGYYEVYGHRYDRRAGNPDWWIARYALSRTFPMMMRVYDQWRSILKDHLGKDRAYFVGETAESYEQMINELKARPDYAEKFEPYYEASKKIFEFLTDLALAPARYCKYDNKTTGQLEIEDFERLRNDYYGAHKVTIQSCDNQDLMKFYEKTLEERRGGMNYELAIPPANADGTHVEVGNYVNDRLLDLDPQSSQFDFNSRNYEKIESAGIGLTRLFAIITLTSRSPSMIHFYRTPDGEVFRPNFMDNPIFRQQYLSKLINRVLNGQQLGELNVQGNNPPIPFYLREKNLLAASWVTMVNSLAIPGQTRQNSQILSLFTPGVSNNPAVGNQEDVLMINYMDRFYVWAHKERNQFAYMLLEKYYEISTMQDLATMFPIQPDFSKILPALNDTDPITLEVAGTKKLPEFLDLISKKFQALQEQYPNPREANYVVRKILGPEINLINTIESRLNFTSDDIVNKTAKEIFEEQGVSTVILRNVGPDSYEARVQALQQRFQQDLNMYFYYREYKNELDAKQDVMNDIINGLL